MILLIIFIAIILLFIFSNNTTIESSKKNNNIKQIDYNLKEYPDEYIFDVSGVHLEQYSYPIYNICKLLNLVNLIPEPTNIFDSNAIKVEVSGWHIGYVPSVETLKVNDIISKDHIAFIDKLNIYGYIIVQVKIRYKN